MQKKIIIIIVAIIIVAAGFFGYTRLLGKTLTNPSITITNEQNKKTVPETINELLGGNLTQKCTIVYPENQGNGTIYVSGKKFNAEFTMNIEGQKMTSYTISDGTYMYIWTSNSQTGMKMKIDEQQTVKPTGTVKQTDFDQKVKLNCSTWTLEQARFTPPANVKFEDLSNFFPKTTTAPQKTEQQAGETICNQISDATAKASCLEAIKNAEQ